MKRGLVIARNGARESSLDLPIPLPPPQIAFVFVFNIFILSPICYEHGYAMENNKPKPPFLCKFKSVNIGLLWHLKFPKYEFSSDV